MNNMNIMPDTNLTVTQFMARYNLVPYINGECVENSRVRIFRDKFNKFSFRIEMNSITQFVAGVGFQDASKCTLRMTDVSSDGYFSDVERRNVQLNQSNIDMAIRNFLKLYTKNIPGFLNLDIGS